MRVQARDGNALCLIDYKLKGRDVRRDEGGSC